MDHKTSAAWACWREGEGERGEEGEGRQTDRQIEGLELELELENFIFQTERHTETII